MIKSLLIAYVVEQFKSHPIIFTTGYASRIAYEIDPEANNHFYMVGSMGMASAIGRGVASMLPELSRFPVVIDGDGAFLMGLHSLLLETELPSSILHLVANDNIYSSTGGQATPVSVANINQFARAAGYEYVAELRDPQKDLARSVAIAVDTVRLGRSALLNCYVEAGPAPTKRIDIPLPIISQRFRDFVIADATND